MEEQQFTVYVVTHEHRFGSDSHLFKTARPIDFAEDDDIERRVALQCDLDFEPERGETLTIHPADISNITIVDLDSPLPPEEDGEDEEREDGYMPPATSNGKPVGPNISFVDSLDDPE